MPVELSIVESVTDLETTVVQVVLESASEPGPAGVGVPAGGTDGQVLTKTSGVDYETAWEDATGGGGGAPDDGDYLVGTATAGLSAEIVVGTSPGGELGGTWASPTVDATHSGSSHASVQAAAEATAASALSTHASDTTGVHGIADTSDLILEGDSRLTDSRAPSGAAGGVLGGTYPNPSFASDMATQAELDAHEADTTSVHGITDTSTLYRAGGTDVALADGGTGASLADPNADRILFWDDSAGAITFLAPGTNLTITNTTIDATGGSGTDAGYARSFLMGGY